MTRRNNGDRVAIYVFATWLLGLAQGVVLGWAGLDEWRIAAFAGAPSAWA